MNYPIMNMQPNFNMPYNTPNLPQNQFLEQKGTLIRVNGNEGAKAFQMRPDNIVALFDENEDYFYIKQSDGAGFSNIRKFKFEEVTETGNKSVTDEWVTKEEFENFKREVMDIGKQFIQINKPNNTADRLKQSTNKNDNEHA